MDIVLPVSDAIVIVLIGMGFLLAIFLALSFWFRPLLFCQYLKNMAGFNLRPKDVREAYRRDKTQGVRDLFLEHYIKADLADSQEELARLEEEAVD